LLHLPHLPDLSRLPRFSRLAASFEAMFAARSLHLLIAIETFF
jgi:hypothetical protein